MIASVRGEVLYRMAGEVVIEAAGVGYKLAVSSETLSAVPAAGEQGRLFTHLVLRDDGINLYGFSTQSERELFLMLIGVQSVGPKVALAVLSGGTPRELLNAIASGDTARFQAVPGIGKRTAERIIVELREKVAGKVSDEIVVRHTPTDDPRTLAREGLLGLGFTPQEADGMLDTAAGDTPEDLIAEALKAGRGAAASAHPAPSASRTRWRCPPRTTSTGRCAPSGSTTSWARSASRSSSRSSSRRPARAARRSTTSCSRARPGSARRRWRRSSRTSWRSASCPPRGRRSSARATSRAT